MLLKEFARIAISLFYSYLDITQKPKIKFTIAAQKLFPKSLKYTEIMRKQKNYGILKQVWHTAAVCQIQPSS